MSWSQIFQVRESIIAQDYLLGNVLRFTVMTAASDARTRSAEERADPAPPPSEILTMERAMM